MMGGLMSYHVILPQLNSKFELVYQKVERNLKIINSCSSIRQGRFYPTFYLGNGTLQGYFGAFSRFKDDKVQFINEEIDLKQEGTFWVCTYILIQIIQEWASHADQEQNVQLQNKKGLIVIVPGLTASCEEYYIVNLVSDCLKQNYDVVIYNDRLYHTRHAFSLPQVGYFWHSIGANLLVKYLGEFPDTQIFDACVSVGNPFDLQLCNMMLSRRKAADKYILQSRQQILQEKNKHITQEILQKFGINMMEVLNAKTSKQFDDLFSVKLHQVPSIDTYFSVYGLENINIPLLCLQALDDPIVHYYTIPKDECLLNPNIILLITKVGGHVGWFEGHLKPRRWYMKPTIEFIDYFTENQEKSEIMESIA